MVGGPRVLYEAALKIKFSTRWNNDGNSNYLYNREISFGARVPSPPPARQRRRGRFPPPPLPEPTTSPIVRKVRARFVTAILLLPIRRARHLCQDSIATPQLSAIPNRVLYCWWYFVFVVLPNSTAVSSCTCKWGRWLPASPLRLPRPGRHWWKTWNISSRRDLAWSRTVRGWSSAANR